MKSPPKGGLFFCFYFKEKIGWEQPEEVALVDKEGIR